MSNDGATRHDGPPISPGCLPTDPGPSSSLADLVRAVEQAGSALDLLRATQELAAAADPSHPQAITALVQVLGYNNPGAAVASVEGLIALGPAAVEPLLAQLDEHNYGARAWAVRALAGIGDVRGLDLLEQALREDIGPSVRRAAARGLGRMRVAHLETGPRGSVQERCLVALEGGGADSEWVVRYAVAVGLESLALTLAPGSPPRRRAEGALDQLRSHREAIPVVRLRAERALLRLGGCDGAP